MERATMPRSELLRARLCDAQTERKRRSSSTLPLQATNDIALPPLDDGDDDLWIANHAHQLETATTEVRRLSASMHANTDAYTKPPNSRRTSQLVSPAQSSRDMGVREMEEHVSKLSKLNFDLKLEVYHRREKVEELERKVQRLEEVLEERAVQESERERLHTDNKELLEMNEQLLAELERRDKAIDEAVGIIGDLEGRIEMLLEQDANIGIKKQPTISANPLPATEFQRGLIRRSPSLINRQTSANTDILESEHPKRASILGKLPTYAFLPRRAYDHGPGSQESHSIHGLSELDASSSLPLNQSSPTPDFKSGSPAENHLRSARIREARTSRWVVDRALYPATQPVIQQSFDTDNAEFASLDHVLQSVPPRGSSFSPQRRIAASPRASNVDEVAFGSATNMRVRNDSPATPDIMPLRPLRHASPSIKRGERGLPETPLSRRQTNSSSTLSSDNPISAGGHISKLDCILPVDIAFYYDGPTLDTCSDPDYGDGTSCQVATHRNLDYKPSCHAKRRVEPDTNLSTASIHGTAEAIHRTSSVKVHFNAKRPLSDTQQETFLQKAQSEPRPTHRLAFLQSEPITPTIRRYVNVTSTEPALQHQLFADESTHTVDKTKALERSVQANNPPNINYITPPHRTSSLKHHTPTLTRTRSPSSSGIPFIPAIKHSPSPSTPSKSPPLPATVTTLTITSPLLIATERPLHSSMSTHSEPSRTSTVSGTSWTKVATPSDTSGVSVSEGRGSPTIVLKKERRKDSRRNSLVRRFSLKGNGEQGRGGVDQLPWV